VRRLGGLLGALLLLAGCSGQGSAPVPHPVRWTKIDLHSTDRVLVRGAFACGDDLVVVGATADAAGDTRPAAWRVRALRATPVPLDPHGDPYAREEILTAGACRPDGRMSLFGSKSGGAHGLPRSSAWHERPDGTMVATRNPFEVFGGPNVGSYGPMAADDRGWLMVGTRTTGGAVWTSRDGGRYRLREGAFGPDSHVLDVRRIDGGWVAAGFDVVDGELSPRVWTSPDARHWTGRSLASGPGGLNEAGRLAQEGDGSLTVAGFDADRLTVWDRTGEGWRREPALPAGLARLEPDGGQPAYVTGAVAGSDGLVVTFSDGTHFRAVRRSSAGTWLSEPLPEQVAVSGDTLVAVTPYAEGTALLLDDGREGRIYLERPAA
jgi:hypothetical protein